MRQKKNNPTAGFDAESHFRSTVQSYIQYMVITYSRVSGKVANPAQGQLNREMDISLKPLAPEKLVSRDGYGCPVPCQTAHSPHSG